MFLLLAKVPGGSHLLTMGKGSYISIHGLFVGNCNTLTMGHDLNQKQLRPDNERQQVDTLVHLSPPFVLSGFPRARDAQLLVQVGEGHARGATVTGLEAQAGDRRGRGSATTQKAASPVRPRPVTGYFHMPESRRLTEVCIFQNVNFKYVGMESRISNSATLRRSGFRVLSTGRISQL